MEIKDKEKEPFSKLLELSPDLKITCVKPDHSSYVIPIQSSTFPIFYPSYKRRLYISESLPISKCLELLDLKDVEIVKK